MTALAALRDYDPLLDKSYRDTALGVDVVAWLAWLELGGSADSTLDQYERDLARLCLMYPRLGVAELTDAELAHAVASWPKPSRRVRKAAIASFFKWARRTKRIVANPVEELPEIKRSPQKVIDVFSEAEVDDLTGLGFDDGVLMTILVEAGLRKGEARNLQVRRCKLLDRELVVVGGKGGKDRLVPMSQRLHTELSSFLALARLGEQDYLWYDRPGGGSVIRRSHPIGPGSFQLWWKRCIAAAGVRYRNPHVTRHTFATRWLRRGGRLTTLSGVMGHASIRTTFDLYGHLDTRDAHADLLLIEGGGE